MKRSKRRLPLALPAMTCVPKCGDCCGLVPASAKEMQAIAAYARAHGIAPRDQGSTCPFFQQGGCAVYPVRPRVCQAYGHGPDRLQCPHGRNTNVEDQAALRRWVMEPGMPAGLLHDLLRQFAVMP